MTLHSGIDGSGPIRSRPIASPEARPEQRRGAVSWRLGVGTLACPGCDAPVAPPLRALSPAEPIGCGFCDHVAAVRDFLSLAPPTRPTRVEVRVVMRGRR